MCALRHEYLNGNLAENVILSICDAKNRKSDKNNRINTSPREILTILPLLRMTNIMNLIFLLNFLKLVVEYKRKEEILWTTD